MIEIKDITVGIKSFLRPDAVKRTLAALEGHSFAEVIVADDAKIDEEKRKIYEHASRVIPNFRLLELPFDVGLSAGRNAIVAECSSDYLLMLDDDQEIPPNVLDLAEVLEVDEKIGGVSCFWIEFGRLKCNAANLIDKGVYIIKDIGDEKTFSTDSGKKFFYADFIPNSTLFRVSCLKDCGWDPRLKIGSEHIDFFLSHKRLGKWKFVVCKDVVINHFPNKSGQYSSLFRHKSDRLKKSEMIFKSKWGKKYIFTCQMYIGFKNKRFRSFLHEMINRGANLYVIYILHSIGKVFEKII